MSTNPGTTGVGGYTCPRCGAFVLNGVTHDCVMNAYPRPDPTFQLIQAIYALRDEVKRVADALVPANEETAECICGEINARHCPVHNESVPANEETAE